MAKGLLVAGFDFSGAHADEFHDWYDHEHIPEREAVAGFGACERWIGADNPSQSIATYDLDRVEVLDSEPYRAIAYDNLSVWSKRVTAMCHRLVRFEGTQLNPGDMAAPQGANALLFNAMNIPSEADEEFNAWYDEEHIPALAAVPGTLAARRYMSRGGGNSTHRYVAIYHLESIEVPRGQAWKDAIETPWTFQMRDLFQDRLRVLAYRYRRDERA